VGYDVFISYSHGGDDLLSERVQDALGKFAKPWYRRRALKVFRDKTSLAANPGLWTSISEAIDDSRYFLFLASPDSAQSVWCGREVSQWREKHGSENLLVLLTDGEILWDEKVNDFDWGVTTAVGAAFAGAFAEEPFHIDMRWARSEVQLDPSDGRFRDQIADIASPVHGVAKDELTGEDVRQHRRAIRLAISAAIALAFLTVAAIATSVFAVNAAGAARRSAAQARAAEKRATDSLEKELVAQRLAEERRKAERRARLLAVKRQREAQAARDSLAVANENLNTANDNLTDANNNLTQRGLALRQSTLLAQARLAARRSEQLMGSGDQTYQLGVLLASEAVRHACASSAIDPNVLIEAGPTYYPNDGCTQPGELDGSVSGSAVAALANVGGRYVTGRLAGTSSFTSRDGEELLYPIAWSADGQHLATYSTVPSNPAQVVQVWNADGSPIATATSATGMTSETALSADGTTLALTSSTPAGNAVSTWSLGTGADPPAGAGHRPALSANGSVVAWIAPGRSMAVAVKVGQSSSRAIALPYKPVEVAVSDDGSLVAALVTTGPDAYSLVPIDANTGRAGRALAVGDFTIGASVWSNPPRVANGATADRPALWFAPGRPRVWVYNNLRHVGLDLRSDGPAPTAQIFDRLTVPVSIGDQTYLQASTPSGRVAVLLDLNATPPTYQVWTLSGAGWTTTGIAPLQLCISQGSCSVSISPNGAELAVSSLSALQIVHLRSPAGSASGIVPNPIGAAASAVVAGPSGRTALSWSASAIALVDSAAHSARRLPIALSPGERFDAVGFSPRGAFYVAVVGQGTGCPCRVVVLDAATGAVVGGTRLGATRLEVANERPVGVSLDDGGRIVAVTFDDNPKISFDVHHRALVTYATDGGRPLLVRPNRSLEIGQDFASAPAFQPGTEQVGIVATAGGSRRVDGVLLDARTGAVAHTLGMQAGVVTLADNSYGNRPSALRFSPDGRKLAWNAGGSVVVWEIGGIPNGVGVSSNVVLTSAATFDPTALAIADNGQVATAGFSFYPTNINNVVLTGDELGRFLQPVGIARIVPPRVPQTEGQISVAIPATGQIGAVALDANGSRFFTDTFGATPAALLAQLCASSSRAITAEEWQTYFPGEPYTPACTYSTPIATALDATPPAVLPRISVPVRARAASASVGSAAAGSGAAGSGAARDVAAPAQAYRKRYMGIVSNSLAVVTRPTYSHAKSPPHSSVHTAAKASVT
jgi:TIR domain